MFQSERDCAISKLVSHDHIYCIQDLLRAIALECSLCEAGYGDDLHRLPRSLKCGHTFCSKCLLARMRAKGVECSWCGLWTSTVTTDVTQFPTNLAVLEIIKQPNQVIAQTSSSLRPLCGNLFYQSSSHSMH